LKGTAMLTIQTDRKLDDRLTVLARRLGKRPEDCALAALLAWVEAHEEAMATAQRFGGDGAVRPPDGFYD
jgi:predicted transcriptional regulator